MKKFGGIFLLLFLMSGCTNEASFDRFEISYTNGWTKSYSFSIDEDGDFRYKNNFYEQKGGKLNGKQLDKLKHEINTLLAGKPVTFVELV